MVKVKVFFLITGDFWLKVSKQGIPGECMSEEESFKRDEHCEMLLKEQITARKVRKSC